ncbi:MAG TPA: hypothetical protein VG815_00490, partial [Chloroflexota bacterium]|nr:hypothetical protein [Chloroflexota bacterium]
MRIEDAAGIQVNQPPPWKPGRISSWHDGQGAESSKEGTNRDYEKSVTCPRTPGRGDGTALVGGQHLLRIPG